MSLPPLRRAVSAGTRREFWITLAPTILVVAFAFGLAYYFVEPAPPKSIVLVTSLDEGGFRWYARKYAEFLAEHGVTMDVREATGSVESVRVLSDASAGAHVAFVQDGTDPGDAVDRLVSLGSLSYIPLWVFHRDESLDDFGGLRGRRIAVGGEGSATEALSRQLLEASGALDESTTLLFLDRREAMDQLEAGAIDAAFVVAPAEAPFIQRFAAKPGIHMLSLARAEAYTRRFPHLSRLVLPRGVFNLAEDVPSSDIVLLAPTAQLVVRESLHPALAYLLMRAATEVHSRPGLLDRAGEFPAPHESVFPLSDEARRYYRSGAPLLQRYLPYWAANLVDRLWVMLVPVLAVLLPVVRLLPPLYRWRMRSRIYRWYARLKEVELQLEERPDAEALAEMLRKMDEMDEAVSHIPTPLAYSDNLYLFRQHIDLVRRRILDKMDQGRRPGVSAGPSGASSAFVS